MIFFLVPICIGLVIATIAAAVCRYVLVRSWVVTLMISSGLFLASAVALLFFVPPPDF
jgi:uncharacterized membrane protein